jgi:hypothetical protein
VHSNSRTPDTEVRGSWCPITTTPEVSIGGTVPGGVEPKAPSGGDPQRLCCASNAAERAFASSGGGSVTGRLFLILGSDLNQFPGAGEFSP